MATQPKTKKKVEEKQCGASLSGIPSDDELRKVSEEVTQRLKEHPIDRTPWSEEKWDRFTELFTYHTNAIEGSKLSQEDVKRLLRCKSVAELERICSKSKLTEKDVEELAAMIKKGAAKRFRAAANEASDHAKP